MGPNSSEHIDPAASPMPDADHPLTAAEQRWHELLTNRYVCEACLTRYFMKYRKCKACDAVGRIRLLTASLFDLADDDSELREMIANGQRMMFNDASANAADATVPPDDSTAPD